MPRIPIDSVGIVALAFLSPALLRAGEPLDAIQPQNIAAHIKQLASNEFEGRAPGTRGEELTIRYLAEQFERAGLEPGNPDGTFFQEVPLIGYSSLPRIEVEAGGQKSELRFLDEFIHDTVALRASAALEHASVVFAGYGIVAPEYHWDDYKDLDVRGKLVIVLGGEPASTDAAVFKGAMRTRYSTRESKYDLAAARGAAAILVVTDPAKSHTFAIFSTFARLGGCALASESSKKAPLISGLITRDAARRLLQLGGQDLERLEAGAAQPGARGVATSATANIAVRSKLRRFTSHNVVARVHGSDPRLKDEYLVYSAHWDHLGRDPTLQGDQIYNGALDNAGGTAQLIEIARAFAAMEQKPRRSVLFIATTGEEKGFLGSRFYVRRPLYPLANAVANINLDGGNVWGVTSDLITSGYGLSTLDEILARAARMHGRNFIEEAIDDGSLYFASDQISFAMAGIPAAFPFSGSDYVGKPKGYGDEKWGAYDKNDYHQVSDEVRADWDYSGAAEDSRWLMIAGRLVADADERPRWKPGSGFTRP